jgi:hypothetical protein
MYNIDISYTIKHPAYQLHADDFLALISGKIDSGQMSNFGSKR